VWIFVAIQGEVRQTTLVVGRGLLGEGLVVGLAGQVLAATDELHRPLQGGIVLGGLFVITFVVGNIVLPRMQGDSLNMDPLVVLLSLAFWGALWGLAGMFLSTPLTVLVMIILAQFEGSRWIAILLSRDGVPENMLEAGHNVAQTFERTG